MSVSGQQRKSVASFNYLISVDEQSRRPVPVSFHLLDARQYPPPVEVCLGGPVEADVGKPRLARQGENLVLLEPHRGQSSTLGSPSKGPLSPSGAPDDLLHQEAP